MHVRVCVGVGECVVVGVFVCVCMCVGECAHMRGCKCVCVCACLFVSFQNVCMHEKGTGNVIINGMNLYFLFFSLSFQDVHNVGFEGTGYVMFDGVSLGPQEADISLSFFTTQPNAFLLLGRDVTSDVREACMFVLSSL